MEYNVIESNDLVKLTQEVNSWLDNGWEVQGSVFVIEWGGDIWYYQTIIRKLNER